MGKRVVDIDEISTSSLNAVIALANLRFDDDGNISKSRILVAKKDVNACIAALNTAIHEMDDLLQYVE